MDILSNLGDLFPLNADTISPISCGNTLQENWITSLGQHRIEKFSV